MESVNIVDAIVAGDKETFMQAFQSAIASKVSDALEIKKVEIASTLVTPETEVTNEISGIETEVDGSGDGENSFAEPVES